MIFLIFATKKLKKTFDKIKNFPSIPPTHMEMLMSYVKVKTKTKTKSPCITFQEANYFLNMFCHEYRGSTKYSDILEDMEYHYNKPASSKVRKLLSKRLNNINRSRNKNKTRISQDFL